jgi:hypothetical protein
MLTILMRTYGRGGGFGTDDKDDDDENDDDEVEEAIRKRGQKNEKLRDELGLRWESPVIS